MTPPNRDEIHEWVTREQMLAAKDEAFAAALTFQQERLEAAVALLRESPAMVKGLPGEWEERVRAFLSEQEFTMSDVPKARVVLRCELCGQQVVWQQDERLMPCGHHAEMRQEVTPVPPTGGVQ